MAGLKLEIVTPSRKLAETACKEVYLPGAVGEIGILPEHAPLVSTLSAGIVRYQEGEHQRKLAVRSGFVQVHADRVVLLADEAALPGEGKAADLQAKRREAEAGMVSPTVDPEGREKLEAELRWIDAQIALG